LLEKSITARTKMLVVNFPHNPTGYVPDLQQFNRIIEIARSYDLYIFSDEMYWLLEHEEQRRLPPAVDCYEKAISYSACLKPSVFPV